MKAGELHTRLRAQMPHADIARVEIDDSGDISIVEIHTGRPGIVIGKRGAAVAALKQQLEAELGPIELSVIEVRRPELEPLLVADSVLRNLVRGIALERTLDKHVQLAARFGAVGCQIELTGALGEHRRLEGEVDPDRTVSATERATAEAGEITCRVRITTA